MSKSSFSTTTLASMQWFFFIFANTVVVPISIGTAFDLPYAETAAILRSSLVFTGIACMLQGTIGHRYPLLEGHSGIMWGLILNLCGASASMGVSLTEIGGGIASGMLLAGGLVLIMGVFKLFTFMQKVFTPMVMSVYLFLLTFQLMLIFFKGMLKFTPNGQLDIAISMFSLAVALLVILIKIKGNASVSNFAILIGMIVGWVVYLFIFPTEQAAHSTSQASFHFFPLGKPNLNVGIIALTFLASLINLSNTIASVRAAANLYKEEVAVSRMDRSYLLTGFHSLVSGVFGLVSYAPFASSIGFLESTRIFQRKPFLIAGGLMAVLGSIPVVVSILTTLPVPVGNAVLFAAYLQLFGTSLNSLQGQVFNSITIHRIALPVLFGICIMNLDPLVFTVFPVYVQPLLSNGFIMGVVMSIIIEASVRWEKY